MSTLDTFRADALLQEIECLALLLSHASPKELQQECRELCLLAYLPMGEA